MILYYIKQDNLKYLRYSEAANIFILFYLDNRWASTRENLSSGVCKQHRRRPACAYAQSDQRFVKYTDARIFVLRIRVSCAFSYDLKCVENANQLVSTQGKIHEYSHVLGSNSALTNQNCLIRKNRYFSVLTFLLVNLI